MVLPKLFVADIDGTLRGKSRRTIGPVTKEAFEELHKKGVLLGIASGRPLWQGVANHSKEWNLSFDFDFLIGMNGSELYDLKTNQMQEFNLLSRESLKTIVDAMHHFDLNPFVYRDGYELSLKMDEEIMASGLRHDCRVEICKEESDLYAEETAKILYRTDSAEEGEKIEQFGRTICNENITCFRTGPDLLEFQNPNINKGISVEKYCKQYGIDLNDVIAFGDAENDMQMLKMAGHSVCLLDGMDEVKAVCKDITTHTCDDDGVGYYLFDHVLNKE